jgi:hypothetical protein
MAIAVPVAGTGLSVSTFGKPVTDELNRLTSVGSGQYPKFGFEFTWTGFASSTTPIPFATTTWQAGGFTPSNAIVFTAAQAGIYVVTATGTFSAVPPPLAYIQVRRSGAGIPVASSVFSGGGDGQATAVATIAAGWNLNVQSGHGTAQNVTYVFTMVRIAV